MIRYPLTILEGYAARWTYHLQEWRSCTKCTIGKLAHEHVFARGTLPCDILFIGEGPGRSEDAVGKPFVGAAGQHLMKWIDASSGNDVSFSFAISNLVLCRPTDRVGGPNRAPNDVEVENCAPRLRDFVLYIAKPKGIVLLGRVPAKHWAMAKWTPKSKSPVLKLTHPAAILHNKEVGGRRDQEESAKLTRFVKEILR